MYRDGCRVLYSSSAHGSTMMDESSYPLGRQPCVSLAECAPIGACICTTVL